MNLLITGAHGFLGKHVTRLMKRKEGVVLFMPTSDQLDLMHPSSIYIWLLMLVVLGQISGNLLILCTII